MHPYVLYPIEFPVFGISFNPSRVAFTVLGQNVYWYGVIIALGFLLAIFFCLHQAKQFGFKQDDLADAMLFAVPLGLLCARIYYVVWSWDSYQTLVDGVSKTDWGAVFAVRDGGLAIYGGVIGGFIAVCLVSRYKKLPVGAMLDVLTFGLLIGQIAGRWGNFFNREAFGSATTLPWRMRLYSDAETFIEVHPTFLYESLWNLLGFAVLLLLVRRIRSFDGQVFLLYVAWYGLGRGLIEGLRVDSLMLGETLRVSQLLAFLSCIAALLLIIYNTQIRPHDPADLLVNRLKSGERDQAEDEKTEESEN